MKKVLGLFTILMVMLILTRPFAALALDTSVDTGKSIREDKEQSQTSRSSHEEKESHGKKKTTTSSSGLDRQDSETIKSIGQAMSSAGADVTLPLEAVFIDRIASLEASTEPFSSCKIATEPKLPADFGLTAEIRPGVIDSIKAEYLSKAAQSNARISDVADEQAVRKYRDCLAQYGAVIAQAYLYLSSDLDSIKGAVHKSKGGEIQVSGMGYDDFTALADAALQKASQGVSNGTIKRMLDRATTDRAACVFDKDPGSIKCGASLIVLASKPQLFVSGIQMYGEKFAGYSGAYKLSKSWSYQDAIEKLKTTSKYSKWASDVQAYAEQLESEGKSKEAAQVRKRAWDVAKNGKQTISPNHLIGGLHS